MNADYAQDRNYLKIRFGTTKHGETPAQQVVGVTGPGGPYHRPGLTAVSRRDLLAVKSSAR